MSSVSVEFCLHTLKDPGGGLILYFDCGAVKIFFKAVVFSPYLSVLSFTEEDCFSSDTV